MILVGLFDTSISFQFQNFQKAEYSRYAGLYGSAWGRSVRGPTIYLIFLAGVSPSLAKEIANEMVELEFEEIAPLIYWKCKSKFMPLDMTFKFNEEVEIYHPILKQTTKKVITKCGNVMDVVTVSPNSGTWNTKYTVGSTFMTVVSKTFFLILE